MQPHKPVRTSSMWAPQTCDLADSIKVGSGQNLNMQKF